MYNKDTNKARKPKERIGSMKPTNYTIQQAGCVPYYISAEEYREFTKVIVDKRTTEVENAISILIDTVGFDNAKKMVEEIWEVLDIKYGNTNF